VMVGCYTCEFTHQTYPMIQKLAARYNTSFYFLDWPVHSNGEFINKITYAAYQKDPVKYWKLNDLIFAEGFDKVADPVVIRKVLLEAGYLPDEILSAASSFAVNSATKTLIDQILTTQTPGTPTVFIGDEILIGPKPYRVYAIAIKGLLFWLQ
jgi:protein-disulfide isomerase